MPTPYRPWVKVLENSGDVGMDFDVVEQEIFIAGV